MSREEQTEATKLNLDTLVTPHDLTIRPAETPEDAVLRRWKDRILFVVAVLFTSTTFCAALAAFFWAIPTSGLGRPPPSPLSSVASSAT